MRSYSYSPWFRRLEIAAMALQSALALHLLRQLGRAWQQPHDAWLALLSVGGLVAGYLVADFGSGVTHWLADSYGSPRTPILGANFVTTFREHHSDPQAITRHDFIETNGSSCIFSLPVIGPLGLWVSSPFGLGTMLGFGLGICLTSQIHKWSHQRERSRGVRLIQRMRLVLSVEHHDRHHHAPFDRHYCITTGWLNPVLARLRFFALLEWTIGKTLRLTARAHDLQPARRRANVAPAVLVAPAVGSSPTVSAVDERV